MEREAFLARVRAALADAVAPPLPAALPRTFASGDGRLFERFAEELAAAGGEARRLPSSALADAVAELAGDAGTAVVTPDLGPFLGRVEEGLRRAGCHALEPTRAAAAQADLGITGAALGVAATGSVLLRAGPDASRAASLLPPVHVAVLPEGRLVPGFEELFAAMPDLARGASQTVMVTGPSRTTDIERTLVRGVHGPLRVVVLAISG
ncbi:MAG TPA: lactate utilization protein [Actinomycetota bacterium]|nr:lactate utilization protein [Actinomycetota bacterium]